MWLNCDSATTVKVFTLKYQLQFLTILSQCSTYSMRKLDYQFLVSKYLKHQWRRVIFVKIADLWHTYSSHSSVVTFHAFWKWNLMNCFLNKANVGPKWGVDDVTGLQPKHLRKDKPCNRYLSLKHFGHNVKHLFFRKFASGCFDC